MTTPAAPKLHPKRCETCKTKPCPALEVIKRKPYCDNFGSNYWWDKAGLVSSIVGCASHSGTPDAGARQRIDELIVEKEQWMNNFLCEQQRVEGVVKELERRLAQSKRLRTYFTSEECARTDGYESGLESAIALLKDGVERK
jgi:hypothetical protein